MADGKKGVIVEFDFAAMDGATLLYETTHGLLTSLGVPFDVAAEARYLYGNDYLAGLTAYFQKIKTKRTPLKAARLLEESFSAALHDAIPAAVTPTFVKFVNALVDKDVKVVISTRADIDSVMPAFEDMLSDNVVLYHEKSSCYGCVKWDAWRQTCSGSQLSRPSTVVVVGSGHSVKAALLAGVGSFAVTRPHVDYQDFTGASGVVRELSGTTVKNLISILRV